jgi:hypothetical protein
MSRIIMEGISAVVETDKCPHCRQTIVLDATEIDVFGELA